MKLYRLKYLCFFCLFFLFMALAKTSFADEPLRHVYTAPDNPINVSASGRYVGNADFEDDAGGFSVAEFATSIEWRWFSFSYTGRQYNWENIHKLKFGNGKDDPWTTIHTLSLGLNFENMINQNWGWFAGITGKSSFEQEMDNSFSAFGQAGLVYIFNEDWSTFFGIIGSVSYDDPTIFPFIRINYRSAKDLGFSASIGAPVSYINYRFNEIISLRAGGGMTGNEYKLADDSTVIKKGYIKEQDVTTGLYVDITPNFSNVEHLNISVGAEYTFLREISIYDEDYDKIMDMDMDNALGGFIRLQYTF